MDLEGTQTRLRCTLHAYIIDLAECLQETCEVAKQEHLKGKETQKSYYDKKTKLRTLQEGDQCLLVLPTTHNKLLAQWKGPYKVVKWLTDLNYLVQVGASQKRFHVNMLKKVLPFSNWLSGRLPCRLYVSSRGAETEHLNCLQLVQDQFSHTAEQLKCLQLVQAQFSQQLHMISAAVVVSEVEDMTDCAPLITETVQGETKTCGCVFR